MKTAEARERKVREGWSRRQQKQQQQQEHDKEEWENEKWCQQRGCSGVVGSFREGWNFRGSAGRLSQKKHKIDMAVDKAPKLTSIPSMFSQRSPRRFLPLDSIIPVSISLDLVRIVIFSLFLSLSLSIDINLSLLCLPQNGQIKLKLLLFSFLLFCPFLVLLT